MILSPFFKVVSSKMSPFFRMLCSKMSPFFRVGGGVSFLKDGIYSKGSHQ